MKLILALLGARAAAATLNVSNVFGSHQVLQHDAPNPLWGTDAPGATITVTIRGGSSYRGTAAADGAFVVVLDAHGYGGPHALDVTSTSGGAVTFDDVYFGGVFVCGGQSK